MAILIIINLLVVAFLGYVIGRFGDYYLNFWINDPPAPHHWIYGLVLIPAGSFYLESLGVLIMSFGFGLFISDLKDFLDFKFWGKDGKTKEVRRFWHID